MTEDPIITPHPEVERLSHSELRDALAEADKRLETLHKLPAVDRDTLVEAWLVQERELILAEFRRRYVSPSAAAGIEPFAHFTSDYRNFSSEVKFEREVNAAILQGETIAQGIPAVTFKPFLGRDG